LIEKLPGSISKLQRSISKLQRAMSYEFKWLSNYQHQFQSFKINFKASKIDFKASKDNVLRVQMIIELPRPISKLQMTMFYEFKWLLNYFKEQCFMSSNDFTYKILYNLQIPSNLEHAELVESYFPMSLNSSLMIFCCSRI